LSYSPVTTFPNASPSSASSSSLAAPASLPSAPPKPSLSSTTPPTSLLTTPPHPPPTASSPLSRCPRHPILPRLLSLRQRPPALALSPASNSFGNSGVSSSGSRLNDVILLPLFSFVLHCYYAKVFQSLLKGKGKKCTFGCQICFSFQREVFSKPWTMVAECDDRVRSSTAVRVSL
ncbi:hypothetical protein V8G54_020283, partial [Vigna mungo]